MTSIINYLQKIYGQVTKTPEATGAGYVEERGLNGQPLYFTARNVSNLSDNQRVIELFEKLHNLIGVEQVCYKTLAYDKKSNLIPS